MTSHVISLGLDFLVNTMEMWTSEILQGALTFANLYFHVFNEPVLVIPVSSQ